MSVFASGSKAYGFCDRCAGRYPLRDLRTEYDTGVSRNNRVCPHCWDGDHPQNFLFSLETADKISLENPRPDLSLVESRGLDVKAYQTKGAISAPARARVGTVTVVTP